MEIDSRHVGKITCKWSATLVGTIEAKYISTSDVFGVDLRNTVKRNGKKSK